MRSHTEEIDYLDSLLNKEQELAGVDSHEDLMEWIRVQKAEREGLIRIAQVLMSKRNEHASVEEMIEEIKRLQADSFELARHKAAVDRFIKENGLGSKSHR